MGLFDLNSSEDVYDPAYEKKMFGIGLMQNAFRDIANLGYGRAPESNVFGDMMNFQEMQRKRMKEMRQQQQEQDAAQADENQARYMFKTVGLDYDKLDSQLGGFLPASSNGQEMQSSPIPDIQLNPSDIQSFGQPMPQPQNMAQAAPETFGVAGDAMSYAPPPKPSKLNGLLDKMGWSPEEKDYFAAQAQADPKGAAKYLQDEMKAWRKSVRSGKKETRDVLAKEKAMADALGMTLKDYLKEKSSRSGVNVTVPVNNYGTSFTPAVDAQGNPVLLQAAKGGGQPNVVQGYMPADDAAKVRQSQSAARTRFSSLDRLSSDIKELKNMPGLKYAVGMYSVAPTVPGTAQADAVTSIENLASKAAVQALSDMREASKTGGAVGQVTEKEWPKLEAQLANLNRKQSYEKFLQELDKFDALISNAQKLIDEAQRKEPSIQPARQPAKQQSSPVADPLGIRR